MFENGSNLRLKPFQKSSNSRSNGLQKLQVEHLQLSFTKADKSSKLRTLLSLADGASITMSGMLPDKENNRLGNRPPRAPGSLKMLAEPQSTASSRGHTALSVARTQSAASDPWTDRMELGDGVCEVIEEVSYERSYVSNEPSLAEFEYIKLCPSPDGDVEEDQVSSCPALEATQGQMDGLFGQLPFKYHLEEVASVGD